MPARNFPSDFGRYRLTGLLGSGGMAEVYRAETQPVAGITREVAIKRLLYGTDQDAGLATMLLDEARIWVRLQHPNIVTVYEFGEAGGDFFLALELVEGVTAGELLREEGPLPLREALCIVERVARALAYAHTLEDKGTPLRIVHRDVKPGNVLVSTRGEVKLTDFGIARATDRVTRTQVGSIKGSLAFMAPEQVREEAIDGRADLFALGCMLHSLITGQPLIDKPREAAMIALARGEIPAPPVNLPGPVRALLKSLTAARKEDRPATAQEVARQVRTMLQPELVEDVEPAIGERVRAAMARVQTVKAIRAAQKGGTESNPAFAQDARSSGANAAVVGATTTPAPSPAARRVSDSVIPKSDPTWHPSWKDVDEAALPGGDDLDARDAALERKKLDEERTATEPAPRIPARATAGPQAGASPRRAPARSDDEGTPPGARRPPPRPPAPDPASLRAIDPAPRRSASGGVAGGSTGLSRIFEVAPRFTHSTGQFVAQTGRYIRRAPLHYKIGVAAFFVSVLVIALLLAPSISRAVRAAGCTSAKSGLAGELKQRGFDAAPDLSRSLMLRCSADPDALSLRVRLLATAGDTREALALLPPPLDRTPAQALVAAGMEHAQRDDENAERDAWAIARGGRGDAAPMARCLAAAAAINQDHPERVEGYLTGASDDCARLMRAAAALVSGNRAGAVQLLSRPMKETRNEAAWESALGVLHLLGNDMESALADAKSADDRAGDMLADHPWIWYTMPSPRGGDPAPQVLRIAGPVDDGGFYTKLLLGDTARTRGNLELALKFYDEAVSRGGRTALADLRAAEVLLRQGKPPLARARLTRAVSLDPTYAPALVALARIEEHDRDPKLQKLAVQHATAALAVEPENRDARRIAGRGRP